LDEWNQATNTWALKASLPAASRYYVCGFSIGTKGYIGTGEVNAGDSVLGRYYQDFWEWNQATNTWSRKADFPGVPRFGTVSFSIGTKGYVGTGIDSVAGGYNDFYEWDQSSNTWTTKTSLPTFQGRGLATGFSIGTKGYIGTQGYFSSSTLDDLWEWNQSTDSWTQKATMNTISTSQAVGFSIGTKGYIGTGTSNNTDLSDFWEYTPGWAATVQVGTVTSPHCAGSSISVLYTVYNTFNGGNVFTAQLSNASGSFVSAVNIGSVTSTSSGTISAVIPVNTSIGNAYRIRVISSNPVVIAPDNGSNITITPPDTLNLKFFIQGYYINGGTLKKVLHNEGVDTNASSTNADTVLVELHNATSPYAVIESYKGVLQTNGTMACYFSCNITGHSYYIAVKHRNTIQTWSTAPVTMSASTNYDFTTAANKAYGNNMIQMQAGRWAFYTGDINQDENVDLQDFPQLDYGIVHGFSGYFATDLNGDGNVDLVDFPFLDANIILGIFSNHP